MIVYLFHYGIRGLLPVLDEQIAVAHKLVGVFSPELQVRMSLDKQEERCSRRHGKGEKRSGVNADQQTFEIGALPFHLQGGIRESDAYRMGNQMKKSAVEDNVPVPLLTNE